jgi:XRE family transcriptional regulator, master regulator for biofilm formation
MADVSKSYISQLERGLQTNPSLQFLIKVSGPLDTSLDYLLQGVQEKSHIDLDEEWMALIKLAIEEGMKKEDFEVYRKYIKFQEWLREHNKA